MLGRLQAKGVRVARVTLHVGAGTFQPVRVEDLSRHRMHAERYVIPASTRRALDACQGRVVAVGTTVVRTLEAAAATGVDCGETRLFITPGYRFVAVDALITNFHLPESTLLMLVSAFAGVERTRRAYTVAVGERYRFFSYGDAMFCERGGYAGPLSEYSRTSVSVGETPLGRQCSPGSCAASGASIGQCAASYEYSSTRATRTSRRSPSREPAGLPIKRSYPPGRCRSRPRS